ncbi:hypothetical protein CP533_3085 [Ophiocordyceps camponoti-saundersi (nom. inval.)]|nr:hypothetical protein CP533_3085 [Ophiocordyceps camponoti-saundersi (nom. inval.)]
MEQDQRGPPAQFFILSSPNEGENGQLSCPHHGCDGTMFSEWHSDAVCTVCHSRFASEHALSRHVRASGHQVWRCRKAGCEFEGFEFESCAAYQLHSLSDVHLGRRRRGDGKDEEVEDDDIYGSNSRDAKGKVDTNHERSVIVDDYDDVSSFLCLEPCCAAYKTKGWSKGAFSRHVHGLGHSKAVSAGESLKGMELSPSELASRQAIFRELRCDEQGCALYGHCLVSAVNYFNHVEAHVRHARG